MRLVRVRVASAVGLFLVSSLAIVVACSSDAPAPTPSDPRGASLTIGPAGGRVATSDGAAAVEIPSGALPQSTDVTITPLATTPRIPNTTSAGPGVELGPEGTTFATPVRVVLAFDPATRPAGLGPNDVPVIHTAPRGAAATAFAPVVSERVDATHVAALTNHFSWWTVAWPAPDAGAPCVPETCASLGANCGVVSNGCGGTIPCGACTTGTCGGGGVPNVCGAAPCKPVTCAQQGKNCGMIPDGCGGALNCGACADAGPNSLCGGDGVPNVCGGCAKRTCAQEGKNCGPIGDGCGGVLQCGTCPGGQTCGGGGTPSVCGSGGTCVPLTCAAQGKQCGLAPDGCGGVVECGACPAPQTCGGGGVPNMCGG